MKIPTFFAYLFRELFLRHADIMDLGCFINRSFRRQGHFIDTEITETDLEMNSSSVIIFMDRFFERSMILAQYIYTAL